MEQTPRPGTFLTAHVGDEITFRLCVEGAQDGRAILRTSLGGASVRRAQILSSAETGRPRLAFDWQDVPMERVSPGVYSVRIPLTEVGVFRAKACYFAFPEGRPQWPEGEDVSIKVAPAWTCRGISVYTAFVRQFGKGLERRDSAIDATEQAALAKWDAAGWSVIPPEGTFRDLIRRLDTILGEARFSVIQLLPIHPVPTTYARMGRYGSPFAGLDFLSVNPALAEFDVAATPLEQFRELIDAVHARGGRLFMDLPANHTGWSSTLQLHHPEWFKREQTSGRFISPGAWGVVWEDLVELDYTQPGVRQFMADVFLFWCRQGVDGFRCDAGYMVPQTVWDVIVSRVREQFPDTVFLLEGLGGKLSVTRSLLSDVGLDWAYSEIFQTEDRSAFERDFPAMQQLSEQCGPLIHYAETHDNNRLAARGTCYARMRVALAALLSRQGCFGITNGVEWFADEKVDVHGASGLNWGAPENQIEAIQRLNVLVNQHPAFAAQASVRLVQCQGGNTLAILRTPTETTAAPLLIFVNLDAQNRQPVSWFVHLWNGGSRILDLLTGDLWKLPSPTNGIFTVELQPGQVVCLSANPSDYDALEAALLKRPDFVLPVVGYQRLRAQVLSIRAALTNGAPLSMTDDVEGWVSAFEEEPYTALQQMMGEGAYPRVIEVFLPEDRTREVMVPHAHFLLVRAQRPFRCVWEQSDGTVTTVAMACQEKSGAYFALLVPKHPAPVGDQDTTDGGGVKRAVLSVQLFDVEQASCERLQIGLMQLPDCTSHTVGVRTQFSGREVFERDLCGLLTNGRGAMAHVRAQWGDVRSQYDGLLAANPDAHVPCDRQMLWTRCRLWVVRDGFSTPVDSACLVDFACVAGSGEARWRFRVPVGTGRAIDLRIRLRMQREQNRVSLCVARFNQEPSVDALDSESVVQLILRPDIESRGFHEKTKAYAGPEQDWWKRILARENAFSFTPEGKPGLQISISNGRFTHEPEWHYAVEHAEDAARGLDGCSDLYSPGWFSTHLKGGEHCTLEACCLDGYTSLNSVKNVPLNPIEETAPFEAKPLSLRQALSLAMRDFEVRRDSFQTVIAGYPWFLDWGRDTFIALRGMIADGRWKTALEIVRKFGEFEWNGTLPNMIQGQDASNRDTTDAPLWYIVSTHDLAKRMGLNEVYEADCGGRCVRDVMLGIVRGYVKGTPNGICMDRESGLVYSPSHFTWMDTNYPAGTPRAGYPIEIQALWIAALDVVATLEPNGPWKALAQQARTSFQQYFWLAHQNYFSDCLHADTFRPAATARADDHLRCNQLFALTLGAVQDSMKGRLALRAVSRLLIPGGIRTLADAPVRYPLPVMWQGRCLNDPNRPYWGQYDGDEDTRRKPAYHNGTAWTWPFPSYAEALIRVYGEGARAAAAAYLASGVTAMEGGTVGQLPEILDGDAPHHARGCDAQAWGISEFLRVAILLEEETH